MRPEKEKKKKKATQDSRGLKAQSQRIDNEWDGCESKEGKLRSSSELLLKLTMLEGLGPAYKGYRCRNWEQV